MNIIPAYFKDVSIEGNVFDILELKGKKLIILEYEGKKLFPYFHFPNLNPDKGDLVSLTINNFWLGRVKESDGYPYAKVRRAEIH